MCGEILEERNSEKASDNQTPQQHPTLLSWTSFRWELTREKESGGSLKLMRRR
jgi:hypothetical protein